MEYLCIGKIVNTHGIKGELRLLSNFQYKSRVFVPNQIIYVGRKKESEKILTYRHHKNFEMITLEGYNDINQVLHYKGLPVYIDKDDLRLDTNEYLETDLLEMTVLIDGSNHGVIKEIRNQGLKNPLLVISFNQSDYLLPLQKEFIGSIDFIKKEVEIKPIPGMFL